jgi:hypothetical protein
MSERSEALSKKPYSTPRLNTPTFEQASLFLVGHAWNGDADARYLLEVLFPTQGTRKAPIVNPEEQK